MELDKNALDRHITGNWGEDQFRDYEDTWDDEEPEPEEEDGFIFSTTCGVEASFSARNLGVFKDEGAAEDAIRAAGNDPAGGYWPNVWRVSDHGNHHLIEDFWRGR